MKAIYMYGFREYENSKVQAEVIKITGSANVKSILAPYYSVYYATSKKEATEKVIAHNKIFKEKGNLFEGY